jgi:hypothetical protein
MSSRGLAYRRWTSQRAKAHVRSVVRDIWCDGLREGLTPACVGRLASVHLKPCSKPWCCGNPRRLPRARRVTLAEQKVTLDDRNLLDISYWNSEWPELEDFWMGLSIEKQWDWQV